MTGESLEGEVPPLTELSKSQRRVLGVLVEKAFTTPEYYPLTPKAVISGCNQKSNRSPITNYDEDQVLDTLEELRELQLVGEVHTEGGRTSRFRHYLRKRLTVTEPQLAILTELLLRGRQSLGELRSRAGRMVPIDSLDQLREEVGGLVSAGLVQSSGDLKRRGIEVDHNLYRSQEQASLPQVAAEPAATPSSSPTTASTAVATGEIDEVRDSLDGLVQRVQRLESDVADLRRQLGS